MKKFKPFIVLALLVGAGFVVSNYFATKREEAREQSNRENFQRLVLDMKNDMIQFQANSKDEFKEYLDGTSGQLKGVTDKIENLGIKLKNVERVVSTSIAYRDSVPNTIILDSLDNLLNKLIAQQKDPTSPAINIPFEEENDCFWFKAEINFFSGKTQVRILDRGYNDTITHVGYLERRKWKLFGLINTRILGKKVAKITIFNNCGESKTFIIDQKK